VLISLVSDSDLAGDAQDDGDDILFTSADEVTKLSHEIESFNDTTGQLVAWVKIPSLLSSTDTEIYMYYGYSGASNQEDIANVWDSNYKMVQHLEESSGGTNAIIDSTSNNNDGTDYGSPTFGSTGQVDGSVTFDGTNDWIDTGDDSNLNITDNVTVEAWIYPTASMTHNAIAAKVDQSEGLQYALIIYTSGQITFQIWAGIDWKRAIGSAPSQNDWHYVVGVYDKSNVKVYLDGSETVGQAYSGSMPSTTANASIGDYYSFDGTYAFTGTIDEVRVSATNRSTGWIQTSYNNQSAPSVFITLGSEETETAAVAPIAVGGEVYPVDKPRVLAPWLLLLLTTSMVVAASVLNGRKHARYPVYRDKY